jgi:transposase-like protein
MSDTLKVCPECGSSQFRIRTKPEKYQVKGSEKWLCRDCNTSFDTPDVVRRGRDQNNLKGTAKLLFEHDPKDGESLTEFAERVQ